MLRVGTDHVLGLVHSLSLLGCCHVHITTNAPLQPVALMRELSSLSLFFAPVAGWCPKGPIPKDSADSTRKTRPSLGALEGGEHFLSCSSGGFKLNFSIISRSQINTHAIACHMQVPNAIAH